MDDFFRQRESTRPLLVGGVSRIRPSELKLAGQANHPDQ